MRAILAKQTPGNKTFLADAEISDFTSPFPSRGETAIKLIYLCAVI